MQTPRATLDARLLACEGWLSVRFARVLLVVFLLAAGVRALVQVELGRGPCAWQHRWAETDMHFFDAWARAIASGDLASATVGHPFLGWHAAIAAKYFAEHPDELARWTEAGGGPAELAASAAGGPRDIAARALWNHWYGGETFHQEPLYPYLVAATYRAFGPDPRFVFAWQGLLGACSAVLVAWLARRAFGAIAGTTAGILCALCAPLVFHECVLLRTTLIVFLGLACTALAARASPGPGAREGPVTWILFGAASGLAVLANSTTLPLVAALVVLAAWRGRAQRALLARRLGAWAAAVLVAVAPVCVRNAKVGAPLLSTSSVGALAFVCANTGDFEPSHGFAVDSRHLTAILFASDDRLLPAIPATLSTHASVASYLGQLAKKLDWAWRWYEMPNNENLYAYERFSRVLSALPVRFTLLGPFAIVGIALALASSARRRSTELFLLVASGLAPLLAFYVLSRFRAPLVAAAVPFAAFAMVELAGALVSGRLSRALAIAGVALLATLCTARPLPVGPGGPVESGGIPLIRSADWTAPFTTWYLPRAESAARAGDWDGVARTLGEALEHEPDFVRALSATHGTAVDGHRAVALGAEETKWVRFAALLRRRLADALERAGRADEAVPCRARAAELDRL